MLKSTFSVAFKQPSLCFVSSDTRTGRQFTPFIDFLLWQADRGKTQPRTTTTKLALRLVIAWFTAAGDCWQFMSWFFHSSAAYSFPFCCSAGTSPLCETAFSPLVCLSYVFPTNFNASKADAVWFGWNDPKQRNAQCSSSLKAIVWLLGECLERPLPKMCWVGCKRVVMGRARREGWAQGARGGEGG